MQGGSYVWAAISGFLAGVFVRSLFLTGLAFAACATLLACAILVIVLIQRNPKGFICVVFLFACALGIVRMNAATIAGDTAITLHIGEQATLRGVVAQEPDVRDASTHLIVQADTLITKYSKDVVHATVLVQAPPHTNVAYGDHVQAFGTLRVPEKFDTSAGRQFDYPGYLAVQGISYELTLAQIESTGENSGNPLKALAIHAKEQYLEGEQAVLPEPEAGLAGGITVGDKRSIGPELSADFQRVSLIHMLVLSGYNITVVLNSVAYLVEWLPQGVRYGASGTVVAFFILMSGGSASAIRAGIMALLAVYAHASRRVFLASRALGVTALGMVLYDPFMLVFDPSFQLSVLATIGLILFSPIFSRWFRHVPERYGLREILSATAGTQLAVLPFLLYQSGTLSLVALPANLLALAAVPLAMFFSLIAAVGGMFFGAYATPLAAPAYLLLAYIIEVGRFFANLPFAAITLPAFGAWLVFAAYMLLFATAAWLHSGTPATVKS